MKYTIKEIRNHDKNTFLPLCFKFGLMTNFEMIIEGRVKT